MSLVSFIHAYLHAKNESQILIYQWNTGDLRILISHWLIAIFTFTLELDFSQACSFLRMVMNYKNFDFTQISDKTNDVIFLKSPKTMFLGHFWPFLPDGKFFKKIQLYHTQLSMAPNSSYWWEYTKSCFKENAKISSKLSTTQENITILRLK